MAPDPFAWSARYADQNTPWDLGHCHPELAEWLKDHPVPVGGRALVPGCGTAFDAAALAQAGWQVSAVDVVASAPDPENRARIEAGGGVVAIGDALEHAEAEPFQLVFEHTFFCALDPELRGRWGELMRRSLGSGGEVLALVFPVDRPRELGGPPHGYQTNDLMGALGAGFELLEDRPARHPVAARSWPERWVRARRR